MSLRLPRHRAPHRLGRRTGAGVSALLLAAAGVAAVSPAAQADTAPPDATTPATVSADALPTVQIDGVVWAQVTVGNTVYATGSFSNARPAGAAAGTNQTPRKNLLAYDITTGNLITSFNHYLNAPGYAITASPDGTKLFIGGDFTTVDGVSHPKLTEIDLTTNKVLATPAPNDRVNALAATNSTAYFGGYFTTVNGLSRSRLGGFDTASGALNAWAPTADDHYVDAMVLTPDASRVIVGGAFNSLNGSPQTGLGALNATTGATLPFAAAAKVVDSGNNSAITSLRTDGKQIYGTGYVYGPGGNLEGTFAADPTTGNLNWIEDCHGDTYDSYSTGSVVYTVSHSHFCGNIGAFPQTNPWTFYRALAWTTNATQTIQHNSIGGYADWYGNPAPTQLDWYPTLTTGKVSGQDQAAWSITGNASYVALGGEFPTVNGAPQQGLVRFAVRSSAPNLVGPRPAATLTPNVVSLSSGTLRVAWQTTFDQDNQALTYKVLRDGKQIYSTTVNSTFWNRPSIGFTDTGLAPGSSHSYRVFVYDPLGNANSGSTVTATVGSYAKSAYELTVTGDGASHYWRLGEPSGTKGYDWAGYDDLTEGSTVGHGAPGAILGDTDAASTFDGSANGSAVNTTSAPGPNTFTIEAWFKTTSTSGGKLVGFGDTATGTSSNYDRHVYLDNAGHVIFGVYNNGVYTVTSPGTYNDGAYHLVTATLSSAGMALYIDGQPVGTNTGTTAGQAYSGYWRIGGDNLNGWSSRPASNYLAATIDDVAIYPTALTADRVSAHYQAATTNPPPPNQAPTAAFTGTCTNLSCSFDGSGSSDPDGTVASYAWDFGDGTTGTGVNPTHAYAAAGTYTVNLTVTDNAGATSPAASHQVTATAAPTILAKDSFNRTVSGGLGTADLGGAWTSTTSSALSVAPQVASFLMPAAGKEAAAYLAGVKSTGAETDVTVTTDKAIDTGGAYVYVTGRRISVNNQYAGRIKIFGGNVSLAITKLAGSSSDVVIGTPVTLMSTGYAAGTQLNVRFQAVGTGTTTLRLKVWVAGQPEPAAWQIVTTDTEAALQAAGYPGLRTYLSGSATGAPYTVKVSNYQVVPAS